MAEKVLFSGFRSKCASLKSYGGSRIELTENQPFCINKNQPDFMDREANINQDQQNYMQPVTINGAWHSLNQAKEGNITSLVTRLIYILS